MPDRKLKIVVVSANYPGPDLAYGEGFVHARVKAYLPHHDVQVIGYKEGLVNERAFVYENVPVFITGSSGAFYQTLEQTEFDLLLVHFIELHFIEYLLKQKLNVVVFAHGYESLSWKRRMMNYKSVGALRHLIPFMRWNRNQLGGMRRLVQASNKDHNIHFVFVSQWLRDAASHDMNINVRNSSVIPNGINTGHFVYRKKPPELRKKILLLRSFKAQNYANDIAIDAIHLLQKESFFNELEFAIYGEGYLFPHLSKKISHLSNVRLYNGFVENYRIPAIHKDFGIFLCPSRLDTQGVSMCEAMSSGLVPVTSPVGGIVEYSRENESAMYATSPEGIAECISKLYRNPEQFQRMSRQARLDIEERCEITDTVAHELSLFERMVPRV